MRSVWLLLFSILMSQPLLACEVRVRVSDFPPQYYQTSDGTWAGMGVELVEALLQRTNCSPIYVIAPWKRSLSSMRNGKLDIMLNLSITDERRDYIHFIGPMRDETILLVSNRLNPIVFSQISDIPTYGQPVGVLQGAYYGEAFKEAAQSQAFSAHLYFSARNDLLMDMLMQNRLSGILEDKYSLAWLANQPKYENQLTIHDFPINQDWVYFGLSKARFKAKRLLKFQKAFELGKSEKAFEGIMKRYSVR